AEAVDEVLREQREGRDGGGEAPRIGEMLVEKGLLTREQLRLVLRVQLQRMPSEGHLLFGRIASAKRLAPRGAVDRALDAQSREILAGGDVRRLGEILVAAGDMRPADVEAVLAYQASRDGVPMSEARKQALPEGAPAGARGVDSEPDAGEAERERPEVQSGPGVQSAPDGAGRKRPVFLPAGAGRFVLDNSIWIACLAAALAALFVTVFRGAIFG
ncbi:MAG: hypothetical protein ACYTKD_13900, partial [Planctomycetota bacterium]